MFSMRNVSQLIAHTMGRAYRFVYIPVRVTVNPIFYPAVGYHVAKFYGKCTVNRTSLKFI